MKIEKNGSGLSWSGLRIAAALVFAAVILAAQGAGFMKGTDSRFQDYHYQKGGLISPDIYVIGIDEETLMEFGPWQNWGRRETARLIELLNADSETAPAVIGLDIGFFGEDSKEEDEALAHAASLLDNIVTTSYVTFGKEIVEYDDGSFGTKSGAATCEIPYDELAANVDWGFSNVPLDGDGVARHGLYSIRYNDEIIYSFASQVYNKYTGMLPECVQEGLTSGYIPFAGGPYDYYGSQTSGLSMSRVLNGEIPREMFAGSIVLVGPYSAGMMDSYYTAISHESMMFGVEIHANILQAFLDYNVKTELPVMNALLVTAAFMTFICFIGRIKNMKIFTCITAAGIALYWVFTGTAYENGKIFPLLYPIASAVIFFVYHVAWQYASERMAKRQLENIFGKYVSRDVVDGIVKGGMEALKLGGQKKDIAVLFVDIRGFTPLSEALPPEKVVEVLNRYLSLTTKAVFDNRGTVDKFIGDATMAVYNAPLDLDDYVFRAVKTGLDMASSAKELEAEIAQVTDKKVGFGIGINCGEAVIGNIGTPQRMDYTAIGNTVNTAARLESQAKAGEVIISQEVYDRLEGRIEAVSLGKRKLKGISEDAEVYRVEGIKEV